MSEKGLLRFVTCGSVDDGKSTLIGRLLWASNSLFADQLETLARDSRKLGTRGDELDFALLLDGLSAEREQGITIDVAYRYFATARRKFIVADCPGHEQYTRNMITGASTADVALILIDARKGVQVQTRRHCYLTALIGIRRIVVVVSKMDLVDYQQPVFERIESDLRRLAAPLAFEQIVAIPISGVEGDNITGPSTRTAWYQGPALLPLLETLPIDETRLQRQPLRMPVQWVNRPDADFRGFAGTLAGGTVRPGQKVLVQPSGREATIARIVSADGDLDEALAQQSVTLTLVQETDVSRGDILCEAQAPAQVADQFESMLVWMHPQPMLRGRTYLLKIGAKTAAATVTALRYKVEINSFEHQAADRLEMNEIGLAELHLDRPIAFDPYLDNRDTGGFILIDKISNETVAAGMMRSALRRSSNVQWQNVEVNKASRQMLNGHASAVVWLTGLSGAGKSTIANLLEKRLHAHGIRTYLLDGDNVRHGLNRDLGFTVEDRVENIRRIAEVAKLMVDAGLLVITAFISPFRAERLMARELLAPGEFLEVYVRTPLEIAEQRDPKGLYKKARAGELKNFTGIGSPYEEPLHPDLVVDTSSGTAQAAADQLFDALMARGVLDLRTGA